MLHSPPRLRLSVAAGALACALAAAPAVAQQEAAENESPPRIVAVTTFDVPYTDRAKVWSFMRDYHLPEMQLNPKVLNLRVMTHLYGQGAAEVIIMREVADWADINAACGAPCEDYRKANPRPEEGSPGWEDYVAARDLFNKYYTNHRDEIYGVIRAATKIEGRMVGTVGPPPQEVAARGGGE